MWRVGELEAGKTLTAAFVALYAAIYLLYVMPGLNSPQQVFLGLSRALAWSLLVWIGMMIVVYLAYKYVWR